MSNNPIFSELVERLEFDPVAAHHEFVSRQEKRVKKGRDWQSAMHDYADALSSGNKTRIEGVEKALNTLRTTKKTARRPSKTKSAS